MSKQSQPDPTMAVPRRTSHLVSSIETHDFGADTVRVGDLNGDGAPDLLFVQTRSIPKPGTKEVLCNTREITCLTATTISGTMLWQWGEPSVNHGCNINDVGAQIYDWDNDGENEVLFIRQAGYAEMYPDDPPDYRARAKRYEGTATLVVLNGQTGQEKTSLPIPAPADDNIVFADLTGRGRREDFVLKDQSGEHVYGVSRTGELLWYWHGGPWPVPSHNLPQEAGVTVIDEKCEAGHHPAVADIDGDGCDEVFIGFALIDHDGHVLFREDTNQSHQDAVSTNRLADGTWRLLFGNHGVHCLATDGTELWHNPLTFNEAQHVVVGKFRSDSQLQVAVIDRGFPRTPEGASACLYLFDVETGKEFWRRPQLPGGWNAACMDIRWSGIGNLKEICVYKRGIGAPIAIYNGQGEIVDEIEVPDSILSNEENVAFYHRNYYCQRADLWGDSREEVIIFGRNGLRIHANSRALDIAALYNSTFYHGM